LVAAAAVDLFGVSALATRLADPLRLLTSRCRNTPSRYQSMTAALDWSYQLLSEPERSLLRRLALFSGGFSAAAASAVAADEIAALEFSLVWQTWSANRLSMRVSVARLCAIDCP